MSTVALFLRSLSNIRVTDSFKANGKREFVPRDQFFPLLVVTVHYFYANFSLTPVLSIKIVLDNFYLPTAHFLFCENFNLNLSLQAQVSEGIRDLNVDVCPPFRKRQTWRVFLLAVSGFTSAHIWDLRFEGGSLGLPCLFSFIRFTSRPQFKIMFL